jgi:hypothetical protein
MNLPTIKKVEYWKTIWVYWNERNQVIFKSYKVLPIILRRSYKLWLEAKADNFAPAMDSQNATATILINFAAYWANIARQAGTSFQVSDGCLLVGGLKVYLNTPVSQILDRLQGRRAVA